jgi:hypothetical protein
LSVRILELSLLRRRNGALQKVLVGPSVEQRYRNWTLHVLVLRPKYREDVFKCSTGD